MSIEQAKAIIAKAQAEGLESVDRALLEKAIKVLAGSWGAHG